MTTRHDDFKYQICITVVLLRFAWLCVMRCTKYAAWLICSSIWPDMLIKTSSGHDYSAWIQASVLLNVALRGVILASARAAAETNSDSDTESEKFSVKTGSLDVSVRCISSQFLAHFHSGGPFGGICTSACLDNSAVPRVCKETLGKVRADCLKDGSNVT